MALCFQLGTFNTAWVPLSLLFHALFILTVSPVMSITITEAKNIDVKAEGWAIPTVEKPMTIGVPVNTFSYLFVKVEQSTKNPDEKEYSGFCIALFKELVKTLSFDLRYEFVAFNGSYDDLINSVANGTLDAAVGDITILADRWRIVEFTTLFSESGISLVIPVKLRAPNAWMFLTPFSKEVWLATWAILMYTVFIVWLLEHPSNPEFRGPWKDQLGNVFWFTFSSLFFAHRERIEHKYTRVVVVLWLFVVLIVVQSYSANLSSILTVSQLDPNVDSLKKIDAVVGCDGNVIREYLVDVLHFKNYHIRNNISTQSEYVDALKSGRISAAFLEATYAKAIVNQYCDQLTITGPTYKFGGLGFVFQKGSPIATNVSEAILRLSEDGTITKLEYEYFSPTSDCSNFQTTKNSGSLSLQNFWGLYLFYVATSTLCLLLFIIHSLKNQQRRQEVQGKITLTCASVWSKILYCFGRFWSKILGLERFFNDADSRDPGRAPTLGHAPYDIEMCQTHASSVV